MAPEAGPSDDWEDDDEKTTVFDRTGEEASASALLGSPSPAAGAAATAPAPTPAPAAPAAAAVSASAPTQSSAVAVAPVAAAPAAAQPPSKSNTGLIIAVVAIAAAAIVAFLVMTGGPKTGSLAVSVAGPGGKAIEDVIVSVDGAEACQDSVCAVSELEKGSHKVTASAPGYAKSAAKLVAVTPGEEAVLNIELSPMSEGTGVRVSAKGSGLTVKIDGKDVGPPPQELKDMKPGSHEIEISGSPFIKPFKKTVSIRADEIISIEPELELLKGQVTLKLGDNAKGSALSLRYGGGKKTKKISTKRLPVTIDLPADDTFIIRATRKKYEDYEQEIEFTVEEPQKTYTVSLVSEDDEKPSGSSTRTSAPAPSRTTAPAAPAPAPAKTAAPAAPAKPAATGQATLNLNSNPRSSVILDGRPIGMTPKFGVKVSAGTHTVIFMYNGQRKTRVVTVGAGGKAAAAATFP